MNEDKKVCLNCGYKMDQDMSFCPKCGNKIGETSTVVSLNNRTKKRKGRIIFVIILLAILVGTTVIMTFQTKSVSDLINVIDLSNEKTLIDAENAYAELPRYKKIFVFNAVNMKTARTEINQSKINKVTEQIDKITSGSITKNSGGAITSAENAYEALDDELKEEVTNYKKLEEARKTFNALPIALDKTNVSDYLDFDVYFSDLNDSSIYAAGYEFGFGTATMSVNSRSKVNGYIFENVSVTIEPIDNNAVRSVGWEIDPVTIYVSVDGSSSKSTTIRYNSMLTSPILPSCDKINITAVSGNVKHSE